jgi:integrase/recombinase XerC
MFHFLFRRKISSAKFSLLIHQFISLLLQRNKSVHTAQNYKRDLLKFQAWVQLRQYNLSALTPLQITEYLFQESEHLNPQTKARQRASLKGFFDFLMESELVSWKVSPIKKSLHSIAVKDKDIEHTLAITPSEFQTLMKLPLSPLEECLLRLLYDAGLRIFEAAHLEWAQCDAEKQQLYFLRKGGDRHLLKIYEGDALFRSLDLLRKQMPKAVHVMSSKEGGSLSERDLFRRVKKIMQRASLVRATTLSPHSFRKGCASYLYFKTKDLMLVRDYLNHKDAKVTQSYIDLSAVNF